MTMQRQITGSLDPSAFVSNVADPIRNNAGRRLGRDNEAIFR